MKEEDTVTVGQLVAKITVGSADAGDAGKAAGKDDSATGPASIESEALEKESPISAGIRMDYVFGSMQECARIWPDFRKSRLGIQAKGFLGVFILRECSPGECNSAQ